MKTQTPFDTEDQLNRISALKVFLDGLLKGIQIPDARLKALDVGCGIGLLSEPLLRADFDVTAVDARPENIVESERRFPNVRFQMLDVERNDLTTLGQFHVVVCFGLLYHLENPLRVIRDLSAVTSHVLVVESMIAPGKAPLAVVVNEPPGVNRALRGVAFVPTENCLIKMCYQAGFKAVYRPRRLLDVTGYRPTLIHRRKRTVLVAAKSHITDPSLAMVSEPWADRRDLSLRVPHRIWKLLKIILGRYSRGTTSST